MAISRTEAGASSHAAVTASSARPRALASELRATRQLLATVSHELRTPMGAIIAMADLLLGTDLDNAQRHYAETLKSSALALVTILNDILDHSKLEAGELSLAWADFDPEALTREVITANLPRCEQRGLSLELETVAELPRRVAGDALRIRQVLTNLIDNAIKFTREGGVTVRLEAASGEAGEPVLRFTVRDTGAGMSPRTQARIFRPFAQADAGTAVRYGGTGLGLSISAMLVKLMGGEIGFDSAEGKGSTFWFTVRCRQASPGKADEAAPMQAAPARPAAPERAAHILVAEDNRVNRMLIAAYLEKLGHSFEMAADGREAAQAARSGRFDLVLMDLQMPEMDGFEAARAIRALDPPAGRVPIVALTADAMGGAEEATRAAGMNGYLVKPIVAADLQGAIARALRSEAAVADAAGREG